MDKAEHDGNEHQCRNRRKNQAADDGAAERRVLLAALAEPERHRRHADDHGQRRHQDGPEAHEAGLERGRDRIAELAQALAREADDQHAVGGRDAHAHDRAGQRRHRQRGRVANSIQTMPASAAGSAVMMTNGSGQDWKLTTISR